jgi:hypothetical protein
LKEKSSVRELVICPEIWTGYYSPGPGGGVAALLYLTYSRLHGTMPVAFRQETGENTELVAVRTRILKPVKKVEIRTFSPQPFTLLASYFVSVTKERSSKYILMAYLCNNSKYEIIV